MVRFDTNPERYNSVAMLKKLESNIVEAMGLDTEVLAMDEEICLNSSYISRNLPSAMQQTLRRNSDFEMVIPLNLSNLAFCINHLRVFGIRHLDCQLNLKCFSE